MDLQKNIHLICSINKIANKIVVAKLDIQFGFAFKDKVKSEKGTKLLAEALEDLGALMNEI